MKYLETAVDHRLGGKCLIALAFIKDDQPDHPKVAEAIRACEETRAEGKPGDVYSNGIALIFLCEYDPKRRRGLIDFFLNALDKRQKDHGGWGYDRRPTGDTSQTQYGTLGVWEAHRNRISVNSSSISSCLDWVIRTQDPSGAWGYQGAVASDGARIEQEGVRASMVAAGLSSLLVCADLYGLLRPGADDEELSSDGPPTGFRVAQDLQQDRPVKPLSSKGVDKEKLFKALRDGQAWFENNKSTTVGGWNNYYLYSVERYKSFEELLSADPPEEPEWYNEGYRTLAASQNKNDGSWKAGGSEAVDTAFAVLFLLRSTQKSIRRGIGEGIMLGGRGAPADLKIPPKIKVGNKLVDATEAQLADMFTLLDGGQGDALDAIAADPTAFVGGPVDAKTARRLQQLVRGGEPPARLLAVRSLGRTGSLDYVPTLLYALTDPDRRVALEARDGLRFLSRRFEGYGMPDNYNDRQRYEALDRWKTWYLTFRPNAVLDL